MTTTENIFNLFQLPPRSDSTMQKPLATFSLYTAQEIHTTIERRSSKNCQLIFIRNGQASLFIDDSCLKLNACDLVLIAPDTAFHLDTSCQQDVVTFIELSNYFIKEILLPMTKQNDILCSFFNKLCFDSTTKLGFLFFQSPNNWVLNSFNHLFFEYQQTENRNPRILNLYLAILLEEVTVLYTVFYQENLFLQERIDISDILAYIEENFSTVNLKSLAQTFHYSPAYLSSLFKKKTSVKFTDYLKELKMKKARDYLLNTNQTIDEIAFLLGYSDRSQFFQVFKSYYALTPLQYKKSCCS